MIEIAKALMTNAEVIIMDEPTAALTEREISKLFEVITALKKNGVSIVYISHRMEEILRFATELPSCVTEKRWIQQTSQKLILMTSSKNGRSGAD